MRRQILLAGLVAILGCLPPGTKAAQAIPTRTSIQQLVGEDAHYGIDFLVFHRVAQGQLRLSATDQPSVFLAELVGRTLGIAAWLSGERIQSYSSLMKLAPDGSLRTIEHVSNIFKHRWGQRQNRTHRYRYDYQRRKIYETNDQQGKPESQTEHDIPPDLSPVDILTAFYNLRIGIYGPFERGSRLLIPTYAGGKFTAIEVNILTIEQQAEQQDFPSRGLLMRVDMDPEVFDTGNGRLYVWFDEAGLPGQGIVEDLIGAGDIVGYLDKEGL